jgi:HEAT repeat protein
LTGSDNETVPYTRNPSYANSALAATRARDAQDVDFLISLLTSTDRFGRIAAATSLGELRSERAVEPLIRCLNAHDDLLRTAAVRALAEIGGQQAADAVTAVGEEDNSVDVRSSAALALIALDDRRANLVLIRMLQCGDLRRRRQRRWVTARLLDQRATEAIPALESTALTASPLERWRLRVVIRRLRSVPD